MTYEEEQCLLKELEKMIFQRINFNGEIEEEELLKVMDEVILEAGKTKYLPLKEKNRLKNRLNHRMRGLDVLTPLLEREDITEIMVNGHEKIFVEIEGHIKQWEDHFADEEKLRNVIQQIVAKANRRVNEASPIVDARLEDGSRVNVVLSPISIDGTVLTIRKFPKEPLSMNTLIEIHSLSKPVAKLLRLLVLAGYNIVISGGTGSGKTTFLNALSNYIPKDERVITIEDSAELSLVNIENLVKLEVRNANVEGSNEITMKDLLKTSLRMRPDRIIVGEVRGAEALDMLQAMNTGHDGSISTGHANSAKDMLVRLETMVLMGVELPLTALRGQIASAIDIVIHLGRLRDKSRKLIQIEEVLDVKEGDIRTQTIVEFVETGEEKGKIQGVLKKRNLLINTEKIKLAGLMEKYQEVMKNVEEDGKIQEV